MDFDNSGSDAVITVRRGAALADVAGEEFAVSEYQTIFAARDQSIRFAAKRSPLVLVCMTFSRDMLAETAGFAAFVEDLSGRWPINSPLPAPDVGQAATSLAAMRTIAREQGTDSAESRLVACAQALSILASLSKQVDERASATLADRADERFRRSLLHIERHITRRLTVTELARIAGVSYRRYTDVFREKTGLSVLGYIRAMRVQLAKERLLETGDIVQASLEAGFSDLSNFYRVFRTESGTTPKRFIGRNGGNSPIITL